MLGVTLKSFTPKFNEYPLVLVEQKADVVEVSHPRSTLEELFLRIVGAAPLETRPD